MSNITFLCIFICLYFIHFGQAAVSDCPCLRDEIPSCTCTPVGTLVVHNMQMNCTCLTKVYCNCKDMQQFTTARPYTLYTNLPSFETTTLPTTRPYYDNNRNSCLNACSRICKTTCEGSLMISACDNICHNTCQASCQNPEQTVTSTTPSPYNKQQYFNNGYSQGQENFNRNTGQFQQITSTQNPFFNYFTSPRTNQQHIQFSSYSTQSPITTTTFGTFDFSRNQNLTTTTTQKPITPSISQPNSPVCFQECLSKCGPYMECFAICQKSCSCEDICNNSCLDASNPAYLCVPSCKNSCTAEKAMYEVQKKHLTHKLMHKLSHQNVIDYQHDSTGHSATNECQDKCLGRCYGEDHQNCTSICSNLCGCHGFCADYCVEKGETREFCSRGCESTCSVAYNYKDLYPNSTDSCPQVCQNECDLKCIQTFDQTSIINKACQDKCKTNCHSECLSQTLVEKCLEQPIYSKHKLCLCQQIYEPCELNTKCCLKN